MEHRLGRMGKLALIGVLAACGTPKPDGHTPVVIPSSAHSATPAPTSTEMGFHEVNRQKARFLLGQAGVGTNFAQTLPDVMYAATESLAHNSAFDTHFLTSYFDRDGNSVGIALDESGEPVNLRMQKDGLFHPIDPDISPLEETDDPKLVFSFQSQSDTQTRTFGIVGYGDDEKNAKLLEALTLNSNNTKSLMESLFAHAHSPLNLLHLADDGMPVKPFVFPGMNEPGFVYGQEDLPGITAVAATVLTSIGNKPMRSEIFISVPKIKVRSEELNLPVDALLAGSLANEAYGSAVTTHKIENGEPDLSGRREAGSTAAHWGTTLLVMEGVNNPFFSPDNVRLIGDIYNALQP